MTSLFRQNHFFDSMLFAEVEKRLGEMAAPQDGAGLWSTTCFATQHFSDVTGNRRMQWRLGIRSF